MSARMETGGRYRAIGPAEDAQEIEIVEVDEAAGVYRTKGARQVAPVIAFGAEHMWRRITVPAAAPAAPAPLLRPWWEGRLCAFDLETTAPDPEEARVVTAAIAICGGGEPTRTQTWLADPGVEIPAEAAEIHGITTEKARADGEPIAKVLRDVATALSLAVEKSGLPLVIFNARYDLTVLDRELRRHLDGAIVPVSEWAGLRVVDPLVIDKWLHRYRKGSRKLDAQAAHYGAKLDGAHDAAFDAVCAARVAWCIGRKGAVIRRVRNGGEAIELRRLSEEWEQVRGDLDSLHAAQTVWAADQAASLEEYFREQGKPEPVERAWPVVPCREPLREAA